MSALKTLIDRKLDLQSGRVLEILADAGEPLDADTIVTRSALSYDAVNRRLKTLRNKKLVTLTHPDGNGRIFLYSLTRTGTRLGNKLSTAAL